MPRKAPTPSVRFRSNTQDTEGEKRLRDNLSKAYMMAARSFIYSLNLSKCDKEMMKNLLIALQRERKQI